LVERHQLFGEISSLMKIERVNFFRKFGTYIHAVTSKKPSKLALKLMTCLWEVPDSNLGRDTSYLNEIFRYFPRFIEKDAEWKLKLRQDTSFHIISDSLFTLIQILDLI
jgi:hypothetical protein